MILSGVYLLGVTLLYAAPLLIWIWEPLIRRVAPFIQHSAMPLSMGLVLFMMWVLHAALYVFVFYFALFWICQYLMFRWGASYSDSLVIPVYLCF